jgi:hypothetical protein
MMRPDFIVNLVAATRFVRVRVRDRVSVSVSVRVHLILSRRPDLIYNPVTTFVF